jgi:LPXTG-motif cell wall-anchored protein
MRRKIFLTVASLSFVLTLPPVHLNAVCAPPPSASSVAGLRTIREADFIIWGSIDAATVPKDAHAAHSFFLKVRGYFQGAGAARVEVSDYGDGDLPAVAGQPGSSIDASEEFVQHFGGQDAVVFASRDIEPYTRQFSTNICTYTAYGDAASSDILPLLRRILGAPQPPNLAQTGPESAAGLMLAGVMLFATGAALRFGARRPKSFFAIEDNAGRATPEVNVT